MQRFDVISPKRIPAYLRGWTFILPLMVFLLLAISCTQSGSANQQITHISHDGIHFSNGTFKPLNLNRDDALTLILYCYESHSLSETSCRFFDHLDASILDWVYLPGQSGSQNCANTWARRQEVLIYTYDLLEPGNFMETLFVKEKGKTGLLVLDEYDRKSLLHQIEPTVSDLDDHALIILQWNPEIGMQVMRFKP